MLADGSKEKSTRLQIPIPNGPRLGNKVLEVEGLQKSYGEKLLVEDLTFKLPPAGIVGIIGPNGAGKTTLFKMIMGEEQPDQQKKCGVLSGGERNRLHLAMTLKTEANVLLLDEPTNDIDVNTLRALEEGIMSFAGCAVVISHDRYFLDRICTHILAFEGDSSAYWFEGTYSEYEENRKKRLGDEGPKRIKYRKLVR